MRSTTATKDGLELWFEILPQVRMDRVPLRTVVLHFRNGSANPIRIYMPRAEPFRATISTITFAAGEHLLIEPEPRPHGYVVTEDDFPLLAAGEERTFEQTFTLDPMAPGAGTRTQRRAGFEPGARARVTWSYENRIARWPGGARTLDGTTKPLFGGGDIPHIWTGALSAGVDWVVP